MNLKLFWKVSLHRNFNTHETAFRYDKGEEICFLALSLQKGPIYQKLPATTVAMEINIQMTFWALTLFALHKL